MIKQLKKYDVQTTPFIASKKWHLLNTQPEDLVLLDQNSESPIGQETFVAVDFIDYSYDDPYGILVSDCNIALDQQELDPVYYEEGVSGSGLFYPTEEQNLNGSYKRLVYQQILKAFYNDYHNPLQMFGLERIDFQTSGIKKHLSDRFKVFSLNQTQFGDNILKGSVVFVDNAFDDNYTIFDDSNGNLIAKPNLFSKIQEVRHIENKIINATASYTCDAPAINTPSGSVKLTASMFGAITAGVPQLPYITSLTWSYSATEEDGFYLYRSTTTDGITWTPYSYFAYTTIPTTEYTDIINVAIVTASYYVTAYNSFGESTGSNIKSLSPTILP